MMTTSVRAGRDADPAAADLPDAGDDPVGGRVGLLAPGEQPILLELAAGVEEELETVADEELALLLELVAILDVALLDPGPLLEVPLFACAHPTLRTRDGVSPDDDDEDAVAVARPADHR